jgi:hypothetical protein
MTEEKLRQWLNTMVDVSCEIYGDLYTENVHTGGGTIVIPSDVRQHLIKSGILECTDDRGTLFYFTGKYGRTVVEVAPTVRKQRTYRTVTKSEERHKIMCLRLATMLKQTTADAFEDMEPELRKQLIRMPYNSLIRPLLLSDFAAGVKCPQLAVRYGVPYHTIYTWIKGK